MGVPVVDAVARGLAALPATIVRVVSGNNINNSQQQPQPPPMQRSLSGRIVATSTEIGRGVIGVPVAIGRSLSRSFSNASSAVVAWASGERTIGEHNAAQQNTSASRVVSTTSSTLLPPADASPRSHLIDLDGPSSDAGMRTEQAWATRARDQFLSILAVGFIIVTWADEVCVQIGSNTFPFVETYLIFLPAASLAIWSLYFVLEWTCMCLSGRACA